MSIVRWNLKEDVSKSLVRRTGITYKARLREINWRKATKSNNYHFCSSRVAKRAELLGHSVETNMMYYTYATKDDMDDLVDMFNNNGEVSPRSHLKVVKFEKEKSLETASFKAL